MLQELGRLQGDGNGQVLGGLELGPVPVIAELDELFQKGLQIVVHRLTELQKVDLGSFAIKTESITLCFY